MLKTHVHKHGAGKKAAVSILSLFCLLAGSMLAGCAVTGEKEIKEMPETMSRMDERQQREMQQASPVRKHDETYLGKHRMKLVEERSLPAFFDERIIMAEKSMTLPQAATKISQLSGIPIEVSSRLRSYIERKSEESGEDKGELKMPIHYVGKLKSLLDNVASYYGASWEWDYGRAHIYRFKTETYDITTGVGRTSLENRISNKSETDGASDKGSGDKSVSGFQKVHHEYEARLWDVLLENIASMVSDDGRVVATESAGSVSVTDTPRIHKEVKSYIDQVNSKLARQVAISVKIYSFRTSNADSLGFSLKAAFENVHNEFSLGAEALRTNVASPSGLFNAAILERSKDEDNYNRSLQQWEGSEAIIEALDEQGDVQLMNSGSGIVMNNQTLPIQNTSRTGYLKRSEISQGETSTTASLEPGSISTGFSLSATPNIMQNNEVVLQYNITLSELNDLKEIESDGSKIQTPETSSRNFMQQVRMKMGETLFLAGFQRDSDEYGENKAGGGLFGWKKSGESLREMVLVSITINEVDA